MQLNLFSDYQDRRETVISKTAYLFVLLKHYLVNLNPIFDGPKSNDFIEFRGHLHLVNLVRKWFAKSK